MSGLFNSDLVARVAALEAYQRVRRGQSNVTVTDLTIPGSHVIAQAGPSTNAVVNPVASTSGAASAARPSTATPSTATDTVPSFAARNEERELFAPYDRSNAIYGASILTRESGSGSSSTTPMQQESRRGMGQLGFDSFINIPASADPVIPAEHQRGAGFPFPLSEQLHRNRLNVPGYGGSARGSRPGPRPRPRAQRTWRLPIVYLGDSAERRRPNSRRLGRLSSCGLGESCLVLSSEADIRAIRNEVTSHFLQFIVPDITDTTAFDPFGVTFSLYYVRSSGARMFQPLRSFYDAEQIRALSIRTLYARPSVTILPLAPEDSNEEEGVYVPQAPQPVPRTNPTLHDFRGFMVRLRREFLIGNWIERQRIIVPQMNMVTPQEILRFGSEIRPTVQSVCVIENESACDLGGVTRGYISSVMKSLSRQPFQDDLFVLEGSQESLTLSANEIICEQGIPRALANFVVFSILNTESGFVGLSKYTVSHMCSSSLTSIVSPTIEDIADADDKAACLELQSLISDPNAAIEDTTEQLINECLKKYASTSTFTRDTAKDILEYIKYHSVVGCRRRALDMLRSAFLDTALGRWISENPNMHAFLFPSHPEPDMDMFMSAFVSTDDNAEALHLLRRFAEEHVSAGKKLSDLIQLVQGHPVLTDDPLLVDVEISNRIFTVSTCDRKLVVTTLEYDEFKRRLTILLEEGERGFTRA